MNLPIVASIIVGAFLFVAVTASFLRGNFRLQKENVRLKGLLQKSKEDGNTLRKERDDLRGNTARHEESCSFHSAFLSSFTERLRETYYEFQRRLHKGDLTIPFLNGTMKAVSDKATEDIAAFYSQICGREVHATIDFYDFPGHRMIFPPMKLSLDNPRFDNVSIVTYSSSARTPESLVVPKGTNIKTSTPHYVVTCQDARFTAAYTDKTRCLVIGDIQAHEEGYNRKFGEGAFSLPECFRREVYDSRIIFPIKCFSGHLDEMSGSEQFMQLGFISASSKGTCAFRDPKRYLHHISVFSSLLFSFYERIRFYQQSLAKLYVLYPLHTLLHFSAHIDSPHPDYFKFFKDLEGRELLPADTWNAMKGAIVSAIQEFTPQSHPMFFSGS